MSTTPPPREPLTVRTLRSVEELASIHDAWRELQWHPWSDLGHFERTLLTDEKLVRPHALVLERAGQVVALAVGRICREEIPWRVGSFTLWRSRARVLRLGMGAVMGDLDAEGAALLCAELTGALRGGEADAVYAHQLPGESPLVAALDTVGGALTRDRFPRVSGGGIVDVTGSFEDYKKSRSKSVRKNLNYYANRLKRQFGDELEIVRHGEVSDLDRLARDCETVASRTYHRSLGVGFRDTPRSRERLKPLLEAGWFRAWVLELGGRPVAFWQGMLYRGTLFTGDTGFDPEQGDLRPGTFLLSHIVEEQCGDPDVGRIDFGAMDADYKRIFGTARVEWVSTYLFGGRPRGLWMAGLRNLTGVLDRSARKLFGRERARRWARKLAQWPGIGGRAKDPKKSSPSGS